MQQHEGSRMNREGRLICCLGVTARRKAAPHLFPGSVPSTAIRHPPSAIRL
jgi:hypothetical protein